MPSLTRKTAPAAPATQAPTVPATQQVSGQEAVLKLVAFGSKWNTDAVYAYVAKPETYESLTAAQIVTVHNAAVSLCGVGRQIDLGSKRRNNKREATEADFDIIRADLPKMRAALEAKIASGKRPVLAWVHQSYSLLPQPGRTRPDPMWKMYGDGQKIGPKGEAPRIAPDVTFVDACKALVAANKLEQQGRSGGFILALPDVAARNREENKREPKVKEDKIATLTEALA
jgi:hypothetical protein